MKWNKNFTTLMFGQSIANIGDVLYMISVISAIFELTGSAASASFVPFIVTSSMFISSILTPLLISKVNLKWLMAGTQIGKTIFLGILALILIDLTFSNYYFLFLIIGLIGFLDGCANPIRQTLIPHYVKPEQLLQANGIAETVMQTIQAVMWFLGSLLLIILSSFQLISLVGGLFAFSSLLLCFLDNTKHQPTKSRGNLEKIKEGWRTLSSTPVLKRIAMIDFFETIAGTVWIAAILYVFVNDVLKVDEKWWGYINGAFFLGLIVGSIYCIKFSPFIEKKLGTFIFVGSFASFIVTILFSINSIPIIAIILSFCIGIFTQVKNIPQQTVIQTSVSKEQLSTVYTSLNAIGTGLFGIGSLMMGMLADLLGVQMVFLISGLLLAIVSTIVCKNKSLFVRNMMKQ